MIRGIALVDHNMPLSVWRTSKVLSLIDHHHDRGNFSDAKPRVIEQVASCSTLVAREVLDNLDQHPHHMPHELPEMLLSVIALDSDGLRKGTEADEQTAKRLLKISTWKKEDLEEVMDRLDQEMGDAKKDLDDLSVRDLLRRDWKGDV